MCLAMPALVTEIVDQTTAKVNVGGVEKEISIALIDEVKVGEYVIIHVGFALTKLNELEAKKTLNLFAEIMRHDEFLDK